MLRRVPSKLFMLQILLSLNRHDVGVIMLGRKRVSRASEWEGFGMIRTFLAIAIAAMALVTASGLAQAAPIAPVHHAAVAGDTTKGLYDWYRPWHHHWHWPGQRVSLYGHRPATSLSFCAAVML